MFIALLRSLFSNEHIKYKTQDARKLADFMASTVAATPDSKKMSLG